VNTAAPPLPRSHAARAVGEQPDRSRWWTVAAVASIAASGCVWWISIRSVDPAAMGDTGFLGVLPVTFYAAVAVLTASFCIHVRRPSHAAVLFLHLVMLIIALHGLASVIEPVPRLSATWRHVGIVHYLEGHALSPPLDAYFSWPGFFSLFASIEPIMGRSATVELARWFPIVIDVAYLAPLLTIFSTFTNDRRLVWLASWLFVLGNWVGQDYFSPQAISLLLYLIVIAVLLRSFRRVHNPTTPDPWIDRLTSAIHADEPIVTLPRDPVRIRIVSITAAFVASAAIVASHQLTPFMLLVGVGLLVVAQRITVRAMAILVAVMCAGWLLFMALPYLRGHLAALLTNVGDLGRNVDTGLVQRVGGSVGHVFVAEVRIAVTASFWLLALVGMVKRTIRGSADIACWLLGIAPFAMIPLQPYGGEILLRAALFSLPFVSFLAAGCLLPVAETPRIRTGGVRTALAWPRQILVAIVCFLLAIGLVIGKYGNEVSERFDRAEVDAVSAMYHLGGPNEVLISLTPSVPWKFEHYDWTYETMTEDSTFGAMTTSQPSPASAARFLTSIVQQHGATVGWVVVTRGEMEYARLLGLAPAGWMEALVDAFDRAPAFERIYDNGEASIYRIEAAA